MNTFEFNKIAGAVLAGILILLVINEVAKLAVHPTYPETTAYAIDTSAIASTDVASSVEEETGPSLAVLLASADIDKGESSFKSAVTAIRPKKAAPTRSGRISTAFWIVRRARLTTSAIPMQCMKRAANGHMKILTTSWPSRAIISKARKWRLRASKNRKSVPT